MSLALVILAIAAQAETAPRAAPAPLPVPAPLHTPASVGQVAVIVFNPPLNQPLLLDISDDRLLPDGSRVRFNAHYLLTFARGQQGVVASLRMLAPDCEGSARLCQAFTSALAPLIDGERGAVIDSVGTIHPLAGSQDVRDLVGDDMVRHAIDTAKADGSDVAAAEIVEALAFIGMPLAAVSGDRTVVVAATHVDVHEPVLLPAAPGPPTLMMAKDSRVDRSTGLVMASDIIVRGTGDAAPLISHRRWRMRSAGNMVL